MQYLRRLSASDEASYYAVEGEHETAVKRYIVSTPWSREVCNRPELLGCAYTSALQSAMTAALLHAPFRRLIDNIPQTRVCVLNFLRGGLNFGLRGALRDAYGFNAHSSAFMSSQRYRVDGRWQVQEDMYRKLEIPRGAVVVTGDVVATGVTVENGLRVLLDHLVEIGSSLHAVVFFTIGCHKLEKHLAEFDSLFRDAFDDYVGSHLVYVEGKFRLVDSRTELRIGIPGTDLIRRDCLCAPEFEASQYERVSHPLERCTIYDAGSRAYDVRAYVDDVLGYWQQVADLARDGFCLHDALIERWPEEEYETPELFVARKQELWQGVDRAELDQLHDRYRGRWTEEFSTRARTPAALAGVCEERATTLRSTLE